MVRDLTAGMGDLRPALKARARSSAPSWEGSAAKTVMPVPSHLFFLTYYVRIMFRIGQEAKREKEKRYNLQRELYQREDHRRHMEK